MSDLIDRNEEWRNEIVTKGTAYDALANLDQYAELGECLDAIKGLPPAQPGVIRCKDCKWCMDLNHDGDYSCYTGYGFIHINSLNWFCADAERR